MKKQFDFIFSRLCVLTLCLILLLGVLLPGIARAEEETTLWLVTEESTAGGMNSLVTVLSDRFQQTHPGVTIRVDILPNQQQERESCLQSMAELMEKGEGPDLFLLPTSNVLTLDKPKRFTYREITPLFPSVTAAMSSGAFADISACYDQDDALGKDSLNQDIMEAGVLEGRRYVLPLRYSMPVIYAFDELLDEAGIDPATLDGSITSIMEEAVNTGNIALAKCVDTSNPIVFSNLLKDGEAALTIQEVSVYLQAVQALKSLLGTDADHLGRVDLQTLCTDEKLSAVYRDTLADAFSFLASGAFLNKTVSMRPARSTTGDVVARVDYYGAVSSSCTQPELAYEFLRQFLLEDAQWETLVDLSGSEWLGPMESSWPVRTKGSVQPLWASIQARLPNDKLYTALSQPQFDDSSLPILDAQIDVVQFPVTTNFGSILSRLNDDTQNNAPVDVDFDALAAEFLDSLEAFTPA